MAELKTKVNDASVDEFINSITDEQQKEDSKVVDKIMQKTIGEKGKMWGTSIVGYGFEHLKYASGRELDWFKIGFSPRKGTMTLYVLKSTPEKYEDLLSKLGKHTIGKGCLYIKKLSDVNIEVVEDIIRRSAEMDHSTSPN